jgi:CRISPR type III-B/RAMP module RAMP protein Cmr1
MSSWTQLQEKLVQDYEFIAEIELETITYMRLGNYKAVPHELDEKLLNEPIAKSLKGIWRWWARAAIIGAYGGGANYKEANKFLNKLLGGMGKGEGGSLFRLEVSNIEFHENYKDKLKEINNEIDNLYDNAKNFLSNKVQKLKLPQNVKVSVKLNPSDANLTIEGKMELKRWYQNAEKLVKESLREYFLDVKKKDKKIIFILKIPKLDSYVEIPRIKLLLMRRRDKGEEDTLEKDNIDSEGIRKYLERIKEEMRVLITKGVKFKISLYGSRDSEKVNFAVSSLLLALIFGGLGSITKRAFGSLKLLSYKFRDNLVDKKIQDIYQKLQNGKSTEEELRNMLNELCKITIVYAKKLFNISETQSCEIPIVPSLSNIRIDVIKKSQPVNLAKIGCCFLKQSWKKHPKESGRNLHTWILGLPRYQEKTGYKCDGKFDIRRISSIGVRCFGINDDYFIILFGLMSKDWCEKLYHVSWKGITTSFPFNEEFLKSVFEFAFKKISECLKRC